MWRYLAIALPMAACYSPNPPFGIPCGEGDACPSDLSCVNGRCIGVGEQPDAPSNDDADVDQPDAMIDADLGACPSGYTPSGTLPSRYRSVTMGATWIDAETDCENDGGGTHLIVIDSAMEQAAVDAMTGASAWTGLSDRAIEGMWRHVTGALPVYTSWASGEPSGPSYDCAGVYEPANYNWVIGDCSELIPYICECDGVSADSTAY